MQTKTDAPNGQWVDALRKCSLFESLSVDELGRIAALLKPVLVEMGEQFIEQDTAGDCLYVVVEGRVAVYRTDEDGRELPLAAMFEGDVIGEMGFFSDGTRTASARAIEATQLLELRYTDLSRCCDSMPSLTRRFLDILTRRLHLSNLRFQETAHRRSLAERSLRNLNEYLDVSDAMALGAGIESFIQRIVHSASNLMDADRGSLFILDPVTDQLWSKVAQGNEVKEIRIPANKGIVGAVMSSGKIINIEDAHEDPRFNPEIDKKTGYRTRSILAGPVHSMEGQVVGVVQIINKRAGVFGDSDEPMFKAFCHQASIAMENYKLYRHVALSNQKLAIMLDVASSLSQELDLGNLIQKIISKIAEVLNCERASFFVYDQESNELWSMKASGDGVTEIRFPATVGLAGDCATRREEVNVKDAYEDPRFNQAVDKKTGFRTRTVLCLPVCDRDGGVRGVTQAINKKGGTFDREDVELLAAISSQIGVALENAQLFARTESMKNYLQSVQESISNSILALDNDNRVVSLNQAAESLFEVSDDKELVGHDLRAVLQGDNDYMVGLIDRVHAGEKSVIDYDVAFKAADGHDRALNINVAPLLDHEQKRQGLVLVLEDITQEKRVKSTLNRYMAKEVVERMLNDPKRQGLGGVRSRASILFADIREFTTISEGLSAEATMDFLNEYFTLMVKEVFKEKGVLDKYMGDALLAVFGIPYVQEDDAVRAVRTGIKMSQRLKTFNQERVAAKLPAVKIGIGINTGEIISGNLGSVERMDYTVIGDGVNIASRLEGLNKQYGTRVLVGGSTLEDVGDEFVFRIADNVRVKGKTKALEVYEVLGEKGVVLSDAQKGFEDGFRAYQRGDFKQAISRLQAGAETDELSRIYVARCEHFLREPPPPEWDGVWEAVSK
jgi:adenylate cyclase